MRIFFFFNAEEYEEGGRIEAQNFCLPFYLFLFIFFFPDTTGGNQIYTQGTK